MRRKFNPPVFVLLLLAFVSTLFSVYALSIAPIVHDITPLVNEEDVPNKVESTYQYLLIFPGLQFCLLALNLIFWPDSDAKPTLPRYFPVFISTAFLLLNTYRCALIVTHF